MNPTSKTKESKMNKYRLPVRISIAVLLWIIVLSVYCSIMDIQPTVFYPLQGHMSADVTYENGEKKHFEDGDFGIVNKGDSLELHVTFAKEYNIKAAELFVPLHNVVLNVSLGSRGTLYRDNVNMKDLAKHYGNRIYEIQLPGGFESKELVIEISPMGRLPYSDLSESGIIPANEGWKQIVTRHTFVFVTMISLMVMAMICICYFTIKSIEDRKLHMGLPIAVFELAASGWFFGSLSMFYLLIEDVSFCAKIEYYTLYLVPIPVSVFIYQVVGSRVMKYHVAVVGALYTIFYVISTIIERLPGKPNYSNMLPSMHIMTGITLICLVISVFLGTKKDKDPYVAILKFGIVVAMICGISELIRFNVVKYLLDNSWITTNGLSGVAIIIVAVSLVVYLIAYSTSEFTLKIERQQLMKLAYQDALTGMSNRADCYRNIEVMEKNNQRVYTMIFIDLNDLKKTNDNLGHDAGDLLLKVTSETIMAYFTENGFTSRWGGDEFVACVFEREETALKRLADFENKIRQLDKEGGYPFRVSVACGLIESTEENYLTPIEAIRLADERMYEKKRKMKAEGI